jgi:subtilisin family serine protease
MSRWSDRRVTSGISRVAATLLLVAVTVGCAAGPRAATGPGALPPSAKEADRQILVTFDPLPSLGLPRAGSSARSYEAAPGYRTTVRTKELAQQLGRDYGLKVVAEWPIQALGVHCVVFEVADAGVRGDVIDRLEHDRRVESVEPMQLFSVEGRIGGDPYRDLQHGFAALGLEEAHRWASGQGVRVAVIDTGVDVSHPDLAGRVGTARDFVDEGGAAPPAERHGTAVTGVIASDRDNGVGIVGVAPGAEILALRGCWTLAGGSGQAACSSFTLAKALSFAIDARPHVINLSLGGPRDALLERLLRVALTRGIVVVAADGETGVAVFPGSVDGVLAVRASSPTGARATRAGELSAPGQEILSTVPGGSYDFFSGSSLAAAQVSGVTALLLEHRRVRPDRVATLLRETARGAGAGAGGATPVVDACAALARVNRGVRCAPAGGAAVVGE